jgi:hypothetical protein
MKNTLAENMIRFGVKNLSESDITKIEESLLTEQTVDLSKEPGLVNAFKSLRAQNAKGIKRPQAMLGRYLLTFTKDVDFESAVQVQGNVVGFQTYTLPFVGRLPVIPDFPQGWGGYFQWKTTETIPYSIQNNFQSPSLRDYSQNITTVDVAKNISDPMNLIPIQTLKAMYAASTAAKAQFDQLIAEFKTNPNAAKVRSALTGNAKAFYGV